MTFCVFNDLCIQVIWHTKKRQLREIRKPQENGASDGRFMCFYIHYMGAGERVQRVHLHSMKLDDNQIFEFQRLLSNV